MDEDIQLITPLKKAGLTETQAKAYLMLVKDGAMGATEIAERLGEARTNGYMIADKLVSVGLATKSDVKKKYIYTAVHPTALEALAERRRKTVEKNEREVKAAIPDVINYFNEYQKAPGVTTYHGAKGQKMVREKILETGKTLYFVRSPQDINDDMEGLHNYIDERVKRGICAESLSPSEYANHPGEDMKKFLQTRTLLPKGDYCSTVEISVFGNNVAFIDHSDNAMSTIIESPAIAGAMQQFFLLAKKHVLESTDQDALLAGVESSLQPDTQLSEPSGQMPL